MNDCLHRQCWLEVKRSGTGGRHWRWNGFGCRWSVAQTAMRTDGVVMPPPGFDQHLGLGEAVEDLAIEQFVAKRPVEAFVVAVFSKANRARCKASSHRSGRAISGPPLL